ncbi:RidA family protein [Aquirhabdus parva]|uniref:Endonuclease n=1 Tax=Aquirhabdus parva TaxID=2283318 RepID=A0A345P408_9GAMM|nr:RidA family protein [Aquirhabdus parva]AXI02017.1 endonuclease [Aquirhabdus parva]
MSSLTGLTRYPFPANDEEVAHAQGPQAGDQVIAKSGTLPFLLATGVATTQEIIFLSGHTPPVINPSAALDSIEAFGDTRVQTIGVFEELQKSLAQLGLTFANLVKLQVFLVGDPALQGRMDNEGFSSAYAEFFGTREQPHLVSRTRVQVVSLVNPGWLVEIEAVAAR